MADVEMKNAGDKKTKEPHRPRNYKLPGGIWRFTRSRMYHKRGMWNVKRETTKKEKPKRKPRTIVKPIGGEKNGGKRVVKLKKQRRYYPTEDRPKLKKSRKMVSFSKHKRYLRKRITPGTVLILLAGRHRGKRVVFLKQLQSGLLLVTGPFKVNGCPLRRINQIYVIATSTKLDISEVKIPAHLNDKYFNRKHSKKEKKDEGEIFELKSEEYTVNEKRKKDQIEVDRQLIEAIKKHPEKKMMFSYLASVFQLRNKMYPHRMKF
ncbi:large ribosomal subunit protein eL6 [Centruroides vittatus]|uniref:large ribosomal subunit protein eL6 n=2 Tax=Centruroides TaxID=6875 RepID=UPI00350FA7A1